MRETRIEEGAQFPVDLQIVHRPGHAAQPLIAFGLADRKRRMSHAKSGMPPLLHVVLGTTQPATEEFKELVATFTQVIRVQRTDRGTGLVSIHVVVEGIDESTHRSLSTDGGEGRVVAIETHDSRTVVSLPDSGPLVDVGERMEKVASTTPPRMRASARSRSIEGILCG